MPNTKRAKAAKVRPRSEAHWRRAKARAAKLRDWSEAKNEAEEAAWWDANSERLMLEAAKRGTLRVGTLEQLVAEMKTAKAKAEKPYPISLRIPAGDIEMAKEQAQKKGMGYQTYLKSLLHQALVAAADSL
jgi:predicted DNA binding CopG/RHH family protein